MNKMEEQVERVWSILHYNPGKKPSLVSALLEDITQSQSNVSQLCRKVLEEMGFENWPISLFEFDDKATPEQYEQLFNTLRRYAKNWAFSDE